MANRDPIALFETELRDFGFIDDQGIEASRNAVAQEIADGIEFAKASPSPDVSETGNYVYTEQA